MKTSVVVNGITLTRQQIEDALKDLDTVSKSDFTPGGIYVNPSYGKVLIPSVATANALSKGFSTPLQDRMWCLSLRDGQALTLHYSSLKEGIRG